MSIDIPVYRVDRLDIGACAYDACADVFSARPAYTCSAPVTYWIEGDGEREPSFACDEHLAWLQSELSWVPNVERLTHALTSA